MAAEGIHRMTPGQVLETDTPLCSKNGKYCLSILISPIKISPDLESNQVMFCLKDNQDSTTKYYPLAERPVGRTAKSLVMSEYGYITILEVDETGILWSVAWSGGGLDKEDPRRDQLYLDNRSSKLSEFVLQDDGNAILYLVKDRSDCDLKYTFRRQVIDEAAVVAEHVDDEEQESRQQGTLQKQRVQREKVWVLRDMVAYTSLDESG